MADQRLLDELAANATAPRTVQILGSWQLRADPTLPFRRANTAIPFAGEAATFDVDARLAVVEDFYRARGLPPRVQIGPSTAPEDLDERLVRRGYVVDAPVDILVADTADVRASSRSVESPQCRVDDEIDERWMSRYTDEPTRRRIAGYRRLLSGIAPRHTTATVDVDGEPAALGFGVLERGWVGIFGMTTRADRRRLGLARVVLEALVRWATDEGAVRAYLQLEIGNEPARELYESVGFVRNHGYHYRVLA